MQTLEISFRSSSLLVIGAHTDSSCGNHFLIYWDWKNFDLIFEKPWWHQENGLGGDGVNFLMSWSGRFSKIILRESLP